MRIIQNVWDVVWIQIAVEVLMGLYVIGLIEVSIDV